MMCIMVRDMRLYHVYHYVYHNVSHDEYCAYLHQVAATQMYMHGQ